MKVALRFFLTTLPCAVLFATPARAFDVPRHVFTFDRLAEAQAEALEDEKPLLLLYTNPKEPPT